MCIIISLFLFEMMLKKHVFSRFLSNTFSVYLMSKYFCINIIFVMNCFWDYWKFLIGANLECLFLLQYCEITRLFEVIASRDFRKF
jgi:hypothetical protein